MATARTHGASGVLAPRRVCLALDLHLSFLLYMEIMLYHFSPVFGLVHGRLQP